MIIRDDLLDPLSPKFLLQCEMSVELSHSKINSTFLPPQNKMYQIVYLRAKDCVGVPS